MLRRTGFKKHVYAPPPAPPLRPATRTAVLANCSAMSAAVEKVVPLRHEGYRRLVASLPCIHCHIHGWSQAAHPNTGKGGGTKTDDALCFPLCTVHPDASGKLVQGCHERFDQQVLFTKAARRLIEPAWIADTQRRILAMGMWPKDLPIPEGSTP